MTRILQLCADLRAFGPNPRCIVNNAFADIDQVKALRTLDAQAHDQSSAGLGETADRTVESVCAFRVGDNSGQQNTLSRLRPTLGKWWRTWIESIYQLVFPKLDSYPPSGPGVEVVTVHWVNSMRAARARSDLGSRMRSLCCEEVPDNERCSIKPPSGTHLGGWRLGQPG